VTKNLIEKDFLSLLNTLLFQMLSKQLCQTYQTAVKWFFSLLIMWCNC